jgi:hypothetical protein
MHCDHRKSGKVYHMAENCKIHGDGLMAIEPVLEQWEESEFPLGQATLCVISLNKLIIYKLCIYF